MTDQPNADQNWSSLLGADMRDLIARMQAAGVAEMELEQGETRLRIRRGSPVPGILPLLEVSENNRGPHTTAQPVGAIVQTHGPVPLSLPPAPVLPHDEPPERPSRQHAITSPLVGTFFASSAPDKPPFIQEGVLIQRGQNVGVVEAMKMFNEIQSDVAGQVVAILVENGQPVEYGQPLVIVELPT